MGQRLAIFDLDGTLINSWGRHLMAVRSVVRKYGLPEVAEDTLRRTFGLGGSRFWLETTGEYRPEFAHDMWVFYAQAPPELTQVYEGIPEALTDLTQNGVRTALLSNRSRSVGGDEVRECGLASYFCRLYFLEDVPLPKPDPQAIHHITREFGAADGETLMVGDSDVDVICARNAGVPVIAVSWGPLEQARLHETKPPFLCHSPSALSQTCLEVFETLSSTT